MEMEVTMLTQLFPKVHRSYTKSPVAPLLEGFAGWLTSEGYANVTICAYLFHLKQVLEGAGASNPNQKFLASDLKVLFTAWTADVKYRAVEHAFLRFLRAREQLIVEPDNRSFAPLLGAYVKHLRDLRGLAQATVRNHLLTVSDFLSVALPEGAALDTLTPLAVEAFLASMAKRATRQSIEMTVSHLRAFFRFCHDRGAIAQRLDHIDRPCTYRGELPPRALKWDLVDHLLSSIDRAERTGCRDYTILYLLAHYGLRPSEAASLVLDSIDWKGKALRVEQSKNHSMLVLPLSDEALQVLKDYLDAGRPSSRHRALFLCAKAPVHVLTNHAIARVYKVRSRRSGLPLNGSSVYALRHSFAMRLLERGVAVKTIGDLLGHHTLQSTCTYLRLQVEALREVALPLPASTDCGGHHEAI
jgi:integrase/recombinase XerD